MFKIATSLRFTDIINRLINHETYCRHLAETLNYNLRNSSRDRLSITKKYQSHSFDALVLLTSIPSETSIPSKNSIYNMQTFI